jgi:hypothetical protein
MKWGGRLVVVTIINYISRDPCLVSLPFPGVLHNCQRKVGAKKKNRYERWFPDWGQ